LFNWSIFLDIIPGYAGPIADLHRIAEAGILQARCISSHPTNTK